jgi:hypothetical protein
MTQTRDDDWIIIGEEIPCRITRGKQTGDVLSKTQKKQRSSDRRFYLFDSLVFTV